MDKKAGGNEAQPDQIIPFVIGCELGLKAEDNSKPAELEIKFARMDLGGVRSKQMLTEDSTVYSNILISNV